MSDCSFCSSPPATNRFLSRCFASSAESVRSRTRDAGCLTQKPPAAIARKVTDRTQIVRVYDSQSPLVSIRRCCGRRHQKRPQAMRASGSPEALGSSTNLASHFNQAWSRPHKGQLETGSLSGRAAKLWGSISIPVETSRPLSGHLTLRTPIVCPPLGLRELCAPLRNYWSARH